MSGTEEPIASMPRRPGLHPIRDISPRPFGAGFLAFGIAVAALAAWLVAADRDRRARPASAEGRIEWVGQGDFAFRFQHADGRDVLVRAGHACLGECQPGAAVIVAYHPRRPALARVEEEPGRWLVPGVLALVALATGALGLHFLLARVTPLPARYRVEIPVEAVRPGRDPEGRFYLVQASWTDPATGRVHHFESDRLRQDPARALAARHGMVAVTVVPDAPEAKGRIGARAIEPPRPPIERRIGNGLLALGIVLLAAAPVPLVDDIAFRLRAERAEARIVETVERWRRETVVQPQGSTLPTNRMVRLVHPVFEFTAGDGTPWRLESALGEEFPTVIVGDVVTIRYDPRDPARAMLPGQTGGVLAALGLGVLGGMLCLGGAIVRRMGDDA